MRRTQAAFEPGGELRRPRTLLAPVATAASTAVFSATLAALLVAAPLAAQEPVDPEPTGPEPLEREMQARDTVREGHQVVRGNTLWDLAADYYGNPYLWPRIYDANRDRIEDPHWIYPGQVLRIPDEQGRLVEVVVGAPGQEPRETEMRPRTPPQERPDDRTVFYPDGSDRRTGTVLPRTAFYPEDTGPADLVVDLEARLRLPVSHSSFYSAEWLARSERTDRRDRGDRGERGDRDPAGEAALPETPAGEAVGRVAGFTGSEGTRSDRQTARPIETLQVTIDPDAAVTVGDLLQSYRPVRTEDVGTILRPSGVLVVRRLTPAGAEATISATFGPIQIGDLVRPAPTFPLEPSMQSVPAESALTARIVAVGQERAIHSLRDVMILDRGADAGLRVGDELVLVTEQPGFTDRVEGRVRVVGVRPTTASARITDVNYPVFEVGRELRLDRRIP